jgi:hypothetical protein
MNLKVYAQVERLTQMELRDSRLKVRERVEKDSVHKLLQKIMPELTEAKGAVVLTFASTWDETNFVCICETKAHLMTDVQPGDIIIPVLGGKLHEQGQESEIGSR